MKLVLVLCAMVIAFLALSACSSGQPAPTVSLGASNYTPLGGVQKNDHPTTSDLADLQAAEQGTLGQPAFVEFYADY